jgi:hypothetical protein
VAITENSLTFRHVPVPLEWYFDEWPGTLRWVLDAPLPLASAWAIDTVLRNPETIQSESEGMEPSPDDPGPPPGRKDKLSENHEEQSRANIDNQSREQILMGEVTRIVGEAG